MGGERKQFLSLAGEPILLRAVRPFLAHSGVRAVVVALPADDVETAPSWLADHDDRIVIVEGGETRRDSVWAGLQALPQDLDVVVVHDGARPLMSPEVVARCIEVAGGGVGAVAGYPAVDTMKRVDETGVVTGTPERSSLWHAQTPQAFPGGLIIEAYQRAIAEDWPATDDAALIEMIGGEVVMVESSPTNLKITRQEDLDVAESVLRRRVP
jgi:2-C-methyl-D-erythritol 4-phosphate cytidylyltransferase